MTLTWPVVLAVLCGAMLHAGWNALVKSSGDKQADTAVIVGGDGVEVGVKTVLTAVPHRPVLPSCLEYKSSTLTSV